MSMIRTLPTDFPSDFLWGASTSAFQVEGAAHEAGKGVTVADLRSQKSKYLDTSVSVDHYHHLEADVALMKELGLKSYRFSISWARIFPHGNDQQVNQAGVDFYNRLLDLLVQNQIEPIVTMFHFDLPQSLVEQYNGWASRQCVADFYHYAKTLFELFGDRVKYWLTINEQSLLANVPAMNGLQASDTREMRQLGEQSNYHMFLAQAKVYNLCHQMLPQAKIGPAVSYMTTLPYDHTSSDVLKSKQLEDLIGYIDMDVAVRGQLPSYYLRYLQDSQIQLVTQPEDEAIFQTGRADFLGLNWYSTSIFRLNQQANPKMLDGVISGVEKVRDDRIINSQWDFSCDPKGLRYALQKVNDRFPNIPIIITECGWPDADILEDGQVHDSQRVDYLNDHIYQLREAIRDGVNVISFNPWSFLDLISVNDGMNKRYGLVFVDRDNQSTKAQKRYKKDSYLFYQKTIVNHAKNVKIMKTE
ncbi:glycoside hydrolase family 1 protein [Bombilactobacillus folatiphilus]|uniref:Glycoside hydrolase family 1 protein n=1 Tax=Bombilactobacillus folatiphilus TaxID=2923362 RepID=A0ABY4P964_9LACO|nr:glycoside hydrolase family 1 protein [Bombilactobacillus folatiphilus]UQS82280.1 glycoside hydrolase family 1 protein [Bombilactobacillus folatiphilus]